MTVFRIVRTTPLPVAEAWRRLTDWPAHAAQVPLTRISVVTEGPSAEGTLFVARTGIGPARFDDPMEIVRWEPPEGGRTGYCRLEKRGRVVLGWAEIVVRESPGGAEVTWTEELRVRGLPGAAGPVLARAGSRVFGRVVDALLSGDPRPPGR
ncbi:immediate-early protein 2 [Streptomyces spongiicola]|uniref:Immediate-early protein 2 n=1 Tax=Streptomyces spongiicola TaxID=1690221 RepID=A0A2S1YYK8_9ACTN|nr:SRPBCC family protein [Streptomyces spongiicola]AWK09201.1 Immediate-early protein 2 [Streptomyces spongiicola]GBP99332.1 immediate-early protein 2 [Streptomyces spongiicola]